MVFGFVDQLWRLLTEENDRIRRSLWPERSRRSAGIYSARPAPNPLARSLKGHLRPLLSSERPLWGNSGASVARTRTHLSSF
jgi:hypothetical protein